MEAGRLLVGLLLLLLHLPAGASDATMSQARRLAADSKWADVERLLTRLTAAEPGHFAAHLLLGEARYKQGKLALAADNLAIARTLRPDSPAAAQLLGYVRFAQQDYGQAMLLLKSAVDLGGDDAITRYRLGLAYERSGQLVPARDCLQQAALRHSQDVPTIAALARLERRLGRHSEAAYWYRKALTLRPGDERLFREMLDAHISAGDHLGAQVALQSHLATNPGDVHAWRRLADTYEKLGLPLQARAVYLRLEQMGALGDAERRALFDGYLREGRWAEAVAQYERMQAGADADLHTAAGQAYANLQMWEQAIATLRRALGAAPTAQRRRLLAGVYYSAGEYGQAHQLYGELLKSEADAELLALAAAAALKSGHSEVGLNLLKRLVATQPDDYPLREMAAQTAQHLGQMHEALAQWYVAEQLPGADTDQARLALAHIAASAGYRDWALEWMGKLNHDALSPRQLAQAAHLADALADKPLAQKAAELLLARADAGPDLQAVAAELLIDSGSPERLQALHRAWQKHTGHAGLGLACVRGLIRQQYYSRAAEVCRTALAENPDQPDLYRALLHASEQWGRPEVAVGIILQVMESIGPNPVAADFLRLAHEQLEGPERAAEEMQALMSRYPDDVAVLGSVARALASVGRHAEAAALHERLIAHHGPTAAHDAALCHAAAGAEDRARQLVAANLRLGRGMEQLASLLEDVPVEAAIGLLTVEPDSIEFYLTLARVHAAADRVAQGQALFEYLATDQEVSAAHAGKAYLLVRLGRHTEALVELRKLSDSDISNPHAILVLAECYLGAGNPVAAIHTARRVVSEEPVLLLRAAEIAALAALDTGDYQGALRAVVQALRISPSAPPAAEALAELCRDGVVSLPEVRRGLSEAYRHAADPTPLLALASDLSALPGFEELGQWVEARRQAAAEDR